MIIRLSAVRLGYYVSIFYLVLLLVPAGLCAECQVTLSWEPNTPDPDGYRLFQRESGENFRYYDFTDAGKSTTRTVSGLSDNTTYHFVVRAYVGSQESGDSNEATYICGGSGGDGSDSGAEIVSNPPYQPVAVSPSNQAMDVNLRPTLTTSTFIDDDAGDYHAKTRWMIYRLDDDVCVFDTTSTSRLTRLRVPRSTLSPFTSYYWSVYYFDQNGDMSAPSEVCGFTTLQTAEDEPRDTPGNSSATLSTGNNSAAPSGGGSGSGCFIQVLF